MPKILGINCKLYRNTGTYGSPTWNEIDGVQDVSINMDSETGEATTRATGGWKQYASTVRDAGIEFEMPYDTADADMVALRDAFLTSGTTIELAAADGAIATTGTQYLRGTWCVTGFSLSEPLSDIRKVSISLKPGISANNMAWVTVS